MINNDDKLWYWFTNIEGIGRKTRNRLLDMFGSPKHLYGSDDETIDKITVIGVKKRKALAESMKQFKTNELEDIIKSGICFMHRDSPDYPSKFKDIPDMPHALYLKGVVCRESSYSGIFDMPSAAVVGSRKCTKYGYETAYRIGYGLAVAGIAVISGMAKGIDSAALRGCVDAGGLPVAVLGCGVDICYPQSNIDLYMDICRKGVIMSEYSPGTAPLQGFFPERNRLISGLADVLIVVEAGVKSGTFITVDMALEQGKEVYAVPGRITDGQSSGCNSLISQGAHVFLNLDDVVKYVQDANKKYREHNRFLDNNLERAVNKDYLINGLQNGTGEKNTKTVNDNIKRPEAMGNYTDAEVLNEKKVYSAVGVLPKHIDIIARETGVGIEEVMRIVCRLELKNLIKHADNNYFILSL